MKRYLWMIAGSAAAVLVLTGLWLLDLPGWKRLDENLLEHLQSASVVYDRHGNEAFTLYGTQNRRLVSLDDLPDYVHQAFVAAEDKRFYSHHGVDLRRIAGAAVNNLRSGTLAEGASTITQQLIKLTHLSSEKSFRRKIAEARLALQAEKVYTKEEILEMYINVVYFGGGAYGVEMAAALYFGKPASELTIGEAALLAGIIKSPNSYSPSNSPEKALQRRNYVLGQMAACGYITEQERLIAASEEIRTADAAADEISNWYRDAVIGEAASLLGISAEDLLGGGYRIDTALDMDMQRQADACMADDAAFPSEGVEGALIAVSPVDGGILAVCGGRNGDVRMALNRALESRRQPGSVIKPISTYAAALDMAGMLPSDSVSDEQRVYEGGYMPGNAGDRYYGMVTLRKALSKSLNAATVSLADRLGVASIRNYARRFGIPLENDGASLAFALGSMTYGVTPAEVAGAYASLANGGMATDTHLITRIVDRSGTVLYNWQAADERIVSEETAAMLTDMLITAATEGTAHALSDVGIPVAGKTGTVAAQNGTRDVWTVAYTPDVCVTVWMGYDSAEQGVMPEGVSGSGYPAKLAVAWLRAVSDGLSGKRFDVPDTLRYAQIDKILLEEAQQVRLAGEYTPANEQLTEIFPVSKVPDQISGRYAPPLAVTDATITQNALGYPVIRFSAGQADVEYLILRHQDGKIRCVVTLQGEAGKMLEFTDDTASLLSEAQYQIVTRQHALYDGGSLITDQSDSVLRFVPLMARISPDAAQIQPAAEGEESLFAP